MKKSKPSANRKWSSLDIKLPVIKRDLSEPRKLLMDEYLDFVLWNLKIFGSDYRWKKEDNPSPHRFKL